MNFVVVVYQTPRIELRYDSQHIFLTNTKVFVTKHCYETEFQISSQTKTKEKPKIVKIITLLVTVVRTHFHGHIIISPHLQLYRPLRLNFLVLCSP